MTEDVLLPFLQKGLELIIKDCIEYLERHSECKNRGKFLCGRPLMQEQKRHGLVQYGGIQYLDLREML